jgi:glycosyltransferase involved in cell wall biosynthesis
MTEPLVSIALPVRNMADTIGRAIESALGQSYTNWELLILDDGSTDDLKTVIGQFSDTRIRLITDDSQIGFAAKLNLAIELAKGQYFARLDADDLMRPERLARQVAFLNQNPNVDLLGTAMSVFGQSGQVLSERLFPSHHTQIVAKPYNGFLMAHPTWLGKTSWFRHWQYQNPPRYEDQDLLLRAYQSSIYANLPDILLDYYEPHFSLKKRFVARQSALVSQFQFFQHQQSYLHLSLALGLTCLKTMGDLVRAITHSPSHFLSNFSRLRKSLGWC